MSTHSEPRSFGHFGMRQPLYKPGAPMLRADSVQRILQADSPSSADRQIQLEQLLMLQSIRKILVWMLVILPLIAALVVGIVATVSAVIPGSSGDSSSYTSLCSTSPYC